MKTDRKLNSWQKKLLDTILDDYERTGTYRGEAKIRQKIHIPAVEIYPDYERDDADLTELSKFETSMRSLELFSPVKIVYKDRKLKKEFEGFVVSAGDVEPSLYELAGRKPRREIHADQIGVYERYLGRSSLLDDFIKEQTALLRTDKNAWFAPDTAEAVMKTVDFIVHNTNDVLYREISIALFGATKYIENHHILTKALRVLKKFGTYDFAETDFDSKEEYEDAVLAEYFVYENPSYVNFNGNGKLVFGNGTRIDLTAGTPIAVRSDRLSDIAVIEVDSDTVLTIENLTSYNRMQTNAFQLYLAGYHNHARQEFLVRMREQNPGIRNWLHFGDLDPDGFCILENLRRKTGIDFKAWQMDQSFLRKYRVYTKSLNQNDRTKAENLIREGMYTETLSYMLQQDVKLEQEIISWKEEADRISP